MPRQRVALPWHSCSATRGTGAGIDSRHGRNCGLSVLRSESVPALHPPSWGPVDPRQTTDCGYAGSLEIPDDRTNPLGGFCAPVRLHARQKDAQGQIFGPFGILLLHLYIVSHNSHRFLRSWAPECLWSDGRHPAVLSNAPTCGTAPSPLANRGLTAALRCGSPCARRVRPMTPSAARAGTTAASSRRVRGKACPRERPSSAAT